MKIKNLQIFYLLLIVCVMFFGLPTIVYADDVDVTVSINNSAPDFVVDVQEQIASDEFTPTNAGDVVTFIATGEDPNQEDYYLILCKTDAVSPTNGGPPTCPGGAWAVSGLTTNLSEASASYTTLVSDVESNDWYGFVCDSNSIAAACSLSSQGPTNVGGQASPGEVDTTYARIGNNGFRSVSRVFDIVQLSNGQTYFGGNFFQFDGQDADDILKLNSDGTLDTSFDTDPGTNGTVYAVAVQSDNKVLIGGTFTSYNSISSNYIARLNTDGSLDTTFSTNIGTGFNDDVNEITLQSDGKILVGGEFTSFNGNSAPYLTRLNTDGSLDTTFATQLGSGPDKRVTKIEIQNDGKVFVSGEFDNFSSTASTKIVKLNSNYSIDNSFNSINKVTSTSNVIDTFEVLPNGQLYIGGTLFNYDGLIARNLFKVNADGSVDNSFFMGNKIPGIVSTIHVQDDNKLILGGRFLSFDGDNSKSYLIRITQGGNLDTTFDIVEPDLFIEVIQEDILDPKLLYVGGQFGEYDGQDYHAMVKINIADQGSFNSPFKVNHRPVFTNLVNDGPLNPGEIVTYTATASDNDVDTVADTVILLVCKTAGISGTECDGGSSDTWCTSGSFASNPSCSFTVDNPLPDGSYNAYGYILDNHDFTANGGSQGANSQHVINNVAPAVSNVTIENTSIGTPGADIFLTENTTTSYTIRGTITDENSCTDLSTIEASLYRSGIGYNLCDTNAEDNNNNCYAQISCTIDTISNNCDGTTDSNASYACLVDIQYHADPTDNNTVFEIENWLTTINAIDDNAASNNTQITSGVELLSLVGYEVTSSIDFGSIDAGNNSGVLDNILTTQATGNVGLDQELSGTDLSSGLDTIVVTSQRYSLTASTVFASGIQLTGGNVETELNVLKTTITNTPEEGDTYFGIEIPVGTLAGVYTGTNTVIAVKSETNEW